MAFSCSSGGGHFILLVHFYVQNDNLSRVMEKHVNNFRVRVKIRVNV